MTDAATTDTSTNDDGSTDTSTGDGATDTDATTNDDAGRAEVDKWKSLARKHEKEAKDRARELDKLRQASMSDTERAVAEAKDAGRAEALASVGGRLARSEIRAAAAGRIDDEQLDAVLEHLDLSAFLDADGEPDADAVRKFVDRIAPKSDDDEGKPPTRRARDLGQGARGSHLPLNGDPIQRDLEKKLGIR